MSYSFRWVACGANDVGRRFLRFDPSVEKEWLAG